MASKLSNAGVLKKIDILEYELTKLKKAVIHSLAVKEKSKKVKPSLFGSVSGGDITEEMIEESKHDLFRDLNDL
ncbi:hypothetical protein HZA55_06435 [Candidatus Poribacteria bacterium]|nr:hypothetical protein [Candidatus Poribacteria bacterium]